MSLKRNLILSIILHVVVIISLIKTEFLIPVAETRHERPIIARLVEPPVIKEERPAGKTGEPLEGRKPVREEKPETVKAPPEVGRKETPVRKEAPVTKPEEVEKPHLESGVPEMKAEDDVVPVPERKGIEERTTTDEKDMDTPSEAEEGKTVKEGSVLDIEEALSEGTAFERAGGRTGEDDRKEEVVVEKTLPSGKALFDQKIIEGIARKGESREKGSGVTFNAEELKSYSYMMKLKRRIESIWIYPPEAARRGIFGDLLIRFTIKRDGRLGAVELIRTSGYRELDEAALKALKDGEPYWPLPEKWETDAITIEGHFIYNLYGTYLR